ncbi:MAG: VWA containing CoxE family protein [Leptospiraceae bacterium]|nr:VWA containing CoxE family protein [Leptospiraceae bacterium]MDW7975137.1 VWA containing CoxE family protein [Leptospiraceae bacterium]
MFIGFLYSLRKEKIPVSLIEFLDLLKVLWELHQQNEALTLERFFLISRSLLVKDTKFYDKFYQVFYSYFGQIQKLDISKIEDIIQNWLSSIHGEVSLIQEQKIYLTKEIFEELKKRLEQQKEEHHGGSFWIGTRGSSPFGQCGAPTQGIRMGDFSTSRLAIEKYASSNYEDYNPNEVFNVRQYKVALKKLRKLQKAGNLVLNIKESVKKTSENLGDPWLVFERLKKNQISLILLMDVGGSMTPFQNLVNRFFSACYKLQYFKEFHHFYFHNTIYEWIFYHANFKKKIHIEDFYKKFQKNYHVIIVGDACMNPYELYDKQHAFFEYYYLTDKVLTQEELQKVSSTIKNSYQRLREFKKHFPKSVWLNPLREFQWDHETIDAIRGIFPMFFLNLNGIERAIETLLKS